MPGMKKCVRCGGVLGATLVDLDINPPRDGRRWTRRFDVLGRFAARLRDHRTRRNRRFEDETDVVLPVITLVLPGAAQFYAGRYFFGLLFITVFMLTVIPALLIWGSWLSAVLISVASGCFCSSVLDIVLQTKKKRQQRAEIMGRAALVIGLLFLPPYLYGRSQLMPVVVDGGFGHRLEAGDVLLASRRSVSQSVVRQGDIVVYDQSNVKIPGFSIQGAWFELVLARGPCRVEYKGHQFKIDGQVVERKPLSGLIPGDFDLEIPDGHVFIAPPVLNRLPEDQAKQLMAPDNFKLLAVVPDQQIIGRIFWRTWPWSRRGAFE